MPDGNFKDFDWSHYAILYRRDGEAGPQTYRRVRYYQTLDEAKGIVGENSVWQLTEEKTHTWDLKAHTVMVERFHTSADEGWLILEYQVKSEGI
jgi:hypothetical protein